MSALPCRIDLPDACWPLHGVQATRALEAQCAAGLPPHTLMARAGLAVARCALALAPHARRVWVVAGGGNNGGDGLEAAGHLRAAGKAVHVTLLGDEHQLPADAATALAKARAAGAVFLKAGQTPPTADLVIDALLGIGVASLRPLSPALRHAVQQINQHAAPTLAIDLPSGLNADTGAVHDIAVHATHTLSLLTLKPGLFTALGRDHAGDIWLDRLQCDAHHYATALLLGREAALPWHAPRAHASHKGQFGDVIVVGGARGMGGAALLAARAALHAGAGRVFVSALDAQALSLSQSTPELMWRPALWQDPNAVAAATVVAGCGGGDATATALPILLSRAPRLLLDADALNAVAADASLQTLLQQRARRGAHTVLTPHPLEAARLLAHADATDVQADRLQAAQTLAARFACTVALKGSGTVIAAPNQTTALNPSGNGRLASAGTGDVLAGWLAGRWSALPGATAHAVTCCAVWEHGAAAQKGNVQAHQPMTASTLVDALNHSA
jgi:ADP-dependent NAD(P)H-hydrate dehydratase / NAD(P)H-hydrate epimerase